VPFDPGLYFFGDEVATGLRAYLAGYDLFHPHRVIGWHCFERASRIAHWQDHEDWREHHQRSLDRMRRLFLDKAGGTSERTVADYEEHAMVSLVEQP